MPKKLTVRRMGSAGCGKQARAANIWRSFTTILPSTSGLGHQGADPQQPSPAKG